MDPNKLFSDVIHFIENSKLNYCIYRKTPFSANIVIKSSLISRIGSNAAAEDITKTETNETKKNMEEENLRLRERLRTAEDALCEVVVLEKNVKAAISEKTRLEKIHEKDKEEIKQLEIQIADYRSELLKIKSDKNKLSQKSKIQEEELASMSEKMSKLEQLSKSTGKELKQSVKVIESKDRDLARVIQENGNLKADLEKALDEKEKLLSDRINDAIASNILCRFCEKTFNDKDKLNEHIRELHQQVKCIQTQMFLKTVDSETNTFEKTDSFLAEPKENLFEDYECFYCQAPIKTKMFLEYHRTNCHINFEIRMHSLGKINGDLKLPCSVCRKLFKSKEDLELHDALYHSSLTAVGFTNWRDLNEV